MGSHHALSIEATQTPRSLGAKERVSDSPEKNSVAIKPRARITLLADTVVVDRSSGANEKFDEMKVALLRLDFVYGEDMFRATDEFLADTVFMEELGIENDLFRDLDAILNPEKKKERNVSRDQQSEDALRRELESFGAVDLRCLPHYGVAPDVQADYLIHLDNDIHAQCSFVAAALPKLRDKGWEIYQSESFELETLNHNVEWYSDIKRSAGGEAESRKIDWFELELGIEINGTRINLLDVLLDMLEDGDVRKTLERGSREFYAIPLAGGKHLPVAKERLSSLLDVVMELYDNGTSTLRMTPGPNESLESLDSIFGQNGKEIRWTGPKELVVRPKGASEKPSAVNQPVGLQATLRDYQQVGLNWLQHLRTIDQGGVLADDMGLGKTLQTISHLLFEHGREEVDLPSIVIAPTSLVGNWCNEIAKFAPDLDVVPYQGPKRKLVRDEFDAADIIVTTFPILIRDIEYLEQREFHFVVLDEAHVIKNARSQAYKCCKRINSAHRLALTGTPIENHLGELWSLFDFLNPGLLGSEPQFRSFFRYPIEALDDEARMETLRSLVSPFILRRMKQEVATDLPPKLPNLHLVDLDGKQRDLYESIRVAAHAKVRKTIEKKGLAASTITILDALTKLRQVCCDPRLVKMEAARFVRESAKMDALMTILIDKLAGGHRVLIFSQFTRMLDLIRKELKSRGLDYLLLTGQSKDRQGLVDAFERGRSDIFLISLKAGGVGLNLVSADTVIHVDPWWNPTAQAQATDRAYRIGQKRPVSVYNLIVRGSVEERILQVQARKERLANAILSSGEKSGGMFEAEDIDELFSPLS